MLIRMKGASAIFGVLICNVLLAENQPALDRKELQAFLDPLVSGSIQKLNIPGAVVVIVQDGQVLLAKGYGYANLASRTPVDPEKPLFRIGSVTKPFTATAAMQMAEAGKLDLNRDVRTYLGDVQLKNPFPRPIIVSNLLTHTCGLDERLARTGAREDSGILSLKEYLKRELPPVTIEPGKLICYSNHGYVLLGYLVEVVSGMPFERYLREHIFDPLKMVETWYGLPPVGAQDLATGYDCDERSCNPVLPAHLQIGPAAGITTTGADMAHFLIAHLNDGEYHGSRILNKTSADQMHHRQFSNDPSLPGMTFGFFETNYNYQPALYHSGGVRGFSSLVYLMPGSGTGIFIADNSSNQGLGFSVVDPFLNHYFPATPPAVTSSAKLDRDRAAIQGSYQFLRYSRRSIEKLGLLRRKDIPVHPAPDGFLDIGGTRFAQISPFVFQQVGSYERAAFLGGTTGRAKYLSVDQDVLERVSWYRRTDLHQFLLLLFIVMFASSFFGWSAEFPGFHIVASSEPANPSGVPPLRVARIISALNLLFLAGIIVAFAKTGRGDIWFGLPVWVYALLIIPIVSSAITLTMPYFAWRVCGGNEWKLSRKIRFLLIAMAQIGFIFFLNYWNLLGFHL